MSTLLRDELYNHWRSFLNLLYPDTCFHCTSQLTYEENFLCKKCSNQITFLKPPTCTRCSRELPPFQTVSSHMCSDCKKTSFNFKKNISLIRYDELAKAIFHEIKHKRRKRVLNIFNPYLESLIKQITIPLDSLIMTCVPLDPKRHRERTFNQSHIIATRLSRTSGIAYHKSILQRKRSKHPQSLLGRKERLTNVQGLFKLKNSHLVKNKDIILVDDILTTGSTVNECARVLLDGNAHSVTVITIARA